MSYVTTALAGRMVFDAPAPAPVSTPAGSARSSTISFNPKANQAHMAKAGGSPEAQSSYEVEGQSAQQAGSLSFSSSSYGGAQSVNRPVEVVTTPVLARAPVGVVARPSYTSPADVASASSFPSRPPMVGLPPMPGSTPTTGGASTVVVQVPVAAMERPTTAPVTLPGTQVGPNGQAAYPADPSFFEAHQGKIMLVGGLLAALAIGYSLTRDA